MIQQLTALRGIGVQSATVLVREPFVRRFANGKALGSYAGLASSPYSSGGIDREQGIGRLSGARALLAQHRMRQVLQVAVLEAKLLWFAGAVALVIGVIAYAVLRRGDVGQG